jgi:hypothetical protein
MVSVSSSAVANHSTHSGGASCTLMRTAALGSSLSRGEGGEGGRRTVVSVAAHTTTEQPSGTSTNAVGGSDPLLLSSAVSTLAPAASVNFKQSGGATSTPCPS